MVGHSSPYYNLGYSQLAAPAAARNASFTSNSVDTQNFDSLCISVSVGASGDTLSGTNRIELSLQDSDDNVTFTNAPDASLANAVAGGQNTGTFAILNAPAMAPALYRAGYLGYRRYVRLAANFYGTTPNGTFISATGVAGGARSKPLS